VYADRGNAGLFEQVARGYGVQIEGVPTVFVGDLVLVGYSVEIEAVLERAIRDCSARGCASPLARAASGPPAGLTPSAVVAGAAVDAINPCAFAVLVILITAILASGAKRRALYAGLAFSLSVFISYYLMGLGLYSAVQAARLTHALYVAIGLLAIVLGLFNLKDYLWYGKWFATEVPQSWRPALKRLLQGVTSVPGAFLAGFVVSLFLLPCESGERPCAELPQLLVVRRAAAAFAQHAQHRAVLRREQDAAPHRREARIAEPGDVAPLVAQAHVEQALLERLGVAPPLDRRVGLVHAHVRVERRGAVGTRHADHLAAAVDHGGREAQLARRCRPQDRVDDMPRLRQTELLRHGRPFPFRRDDS
jgi:hypothetical protein